MLAPKLFNLFFTNMLSYAVRDLEHTLYLKYRLDWSIFDLHHMNAKMKMTKRKTLEALFAEDCAFMVHKDSDLQVTVNKFAETTCLFGLTISLDKTEILLQPVLASNLPPLDLHQRN